MGKEALLKITEGTEGKWQNDSVTRGNLEWRRYEFVQDGEVTRWARLTKLEDGSMRVQEGNNVLKRGVKAVKEEVCCMRMLVKHVSHQ